MKESNQAKRIKNNVNHVFNWSLLDNAPKIMFQQKILEAYYIVIEKPTLNEQVESDRLKPISKWCDVIVL